MTRRLLMLLACALLLSLAIVIIGQDDTDAPLTAADIQITDDIDPFGQSIQVANGVLINSSEDAYRNVSIFADLLDNEGVVIGEGFGVLTNACGVGLLPDFALQPGGAQPFTLALEFFGDPMPVAEFEVFPEGTPTEPTPIDLSQNFQAIRAVDPREVVDVEWIDPNTFRYGVGCDADIFAAYDWYTYEIAEEETTAINHPAESQITEALLAQLDLADPLTLERSYLDFPPNGRRIIYQDDINTLLTAEPDGSFKRLIYDAIDLARFSLHGYTWLPEGRFLAYYYGAIGEPVRYFTASLEGQRISGGINSNAPSFTVPGVTLDGVRTVVTLDIDGVVGYYLFHTVTKANRLLFEADPPGNNWPAPIILGDNINGYQAYIVRPVDGEARLQCYNLIDDTLTDLTALPLTLTDDDRAWTWISPDTNTMALAANGVNGGLWLVGLAALGGCDADTDTPT